MKLTKLSMANYRGFEQLDITFEEDLTVIAGVNGVGKSGVLKAIATILSRALPEFTPSKSKPNYFDNDDIYYGKEAMEVTLQLAIDGQTLHAGISRIVGDEKQGDTFLLLRQAHIESAPQDFQEILASRTFTGDLDAGLQETRNILHSMKERPNPTIAVYFSPKRQLPGRPRVLHAESKPFAVSNAYIRALVEREIHLREFMEWFKTQEVIGKANPKAQYVLENLKEVVTQLIPEFTNLRLVEKPRLGLFVDKFGKPFFLHQLSDGERGLLALVFDLTRRLAIANPESENPMAEGKAIVLIDEVELHLHPKWQRQILSRFKEIFLNTQFIVTTHSPIVLSESEARSVRYLEYDDGKVAVTIPEEAYGMDANRILLELMDSPIRNVEMEEKLQHLFRLIDDEKLDEAKDLIVKLSERLGEFDPELTRASSLIHFLEDDE